MKLFSLKVQLSIEPYSEIITLNVPAATSIQAKDFFLTSINSSAYFIHDGTFWPMLYTRAGVLTCEPLKATLPSSPLPENKGINTVVNHSTPEPAKKTRKPRMPKAPEQGIKPASSTKRKS
jgi:hypothetical protein